MTRRAGHAANPGGLRAYWYWVFPKELTPPFFRVLGEETVVVDPSFEMDLTNTSDDPAVLLVVSVAHPGTS